MGRSRRSNIGRRFYSVFIKRASSEFSGDVFRQKFHSFIWILVHSFKNQQFHTSTKKIYDGYLLEWSLKCSKDRNCQHYRWKHHCFHPVSKSRVFFFTILRRWMGIISTPSFHGNLLLDTSTTINDISFKELYERLYEEVLTSTSSSMLDSETVCSPAENWRPSRLDGAKL